MAKFRNFPTIPLAPSEVSAILVEEFELDGVSTFDVDTSSLLFDNYYLIVSGIGPGGTSTLTVRPSIDGVLETNRMMGRTNASLNTTSNFVIVNSVNLTTVTMSNGATATNPSGSFFINISGTLQKADASLALSWSGSNTSETAYSTAEGTAGCITKNVNIDRLRFTAGSTIGTVQLYGYPII